jgi:hypothetical protein
MTRSYEEDNRHPLSEFYFTTEGILEDLLYSLHFGLAVEGARYIYITLLAPHY